MRAVKTQYSNLGKEKEHLDQQFKNQVDEDMQALRDSALQDCRELEKDITIEEVTGVINHLKSFKAAGPSKIWNEMLIFGGEAAARLLKIAFNVLQRREVIPDEWLKGLIISLFKKGDKTKLDNYRGITLQDVIGKIFSKILSNRIYKYLDNHNILDEDQAGSEEEDSVWNTSTRCMR